MDTSAAGRALAEAWRTGTLIPALQPGLLAGPEAALAVQAAARAAIDDGSAMAALCRDAEMRDEMKIEGSPTWVLNQGRQKLYGNLGYRILEANVREILDRPATGASWC